MTSPTPELFDVPLDPSLFRGAAEWQPTEQGLVPHRLPAWARVQCADPQLAMVEAQPSGVRLAVRTSASVLELELRRSRMAFAGVPPRPDGQVELVVDGEVVDAVRTSGGRTSVVDLATGAPTVTDGANTVARFDGLGTTEKDVELWLPHLEGITVVALRADAPVEPAPDRGRPVWLHHGSSISHGSNATRPTGIWPAVAARLAGVELVNRGFGGSALLDPFLARHLRDSPADVISLKLGINLVNADLMRARALGPAVHGYLDTIRDGHPTTPLLVISPIFCGIHEDTPGPGAFDLDALGEGILRFRATGDPAERAAGKLTLRSIREELARIVAERRADDENLHLVDGLTLYGEADSVEHPLPDALHPDAATHQLMGERFAPTLRAIAGAV